MPKPVPSQLSGMRVGARMRASIWMGSALAVSVIPPASGQDACAGLLADYGYFLQAQKSCSRDEAFGQMTAAKACAKTIPQAAGLTLIDSGRRRWARDVMASDLGHVCAMTFPTSPAAQARPRR